MGGKHKSETTDGIWINLCKHYCSAYFLWRNGESKMLLNEIGTKFSPFLPGIDANVWNKVEEFSMNKSVPNNYDISYFISMIHSYMYIYGRREGKKNKSIQCISMSSGQQTCW